MFTYTSSQSNDDSNSAPFVFRKISIPDDAPLLIRLPFGPSPPAASMRIKTSMSSAFTPEHIAELIKNPRCCMCSSNNVNWFMSNCGHPLCFGSICGNVGNNACPLCGVNGELVHRSDIDPVFAARKKRIIRETLAAIPGEEENIAKAKDVRVTGSNPP